MPGKLVTIARAEQT